jgi:cellulose synthase/poly-beta-1,6-N-acetylglucosamine synthase-like glycosyltransferase
MTLEQTYLVLFWISFAIVAYTFVGYPAVIYLLARLRRHSVSGNEPAVLPSVTVVLAAHNEKQRIITRLENLLASQYPAEKLDVIVVSDGSTDGIEETVRAFSNRRVRLLVQPRSGKALCLNVGVNAANSDIIVFGDVRQRFAPDAIARLVARFNDPAVGAVSGSLEIEAAESSVGGGVDAYWRLEKFIRYSESQFDACIGCTGAIYAIRRSLFTPVPGDTLLDDVVVPMRIAVSGHRVLFEPAAIAYDPQSLEPQREKIRKQRTLAGNYQMMFRYWRWLLPWHNRTWWQLLSHKYLRLVAPLFMLLMLVSNALLVSNAFYSVLFYGQCAFYTLAMLGAVFSRLKLALFSIPAGFVFLNMMSLNGLRHYLRGSYRQGAWPSAKT